MHGIAIIGGDGRIEFEIDNCSLNTYGSQQDGGNGEVRRVVRSIKNGSYDLVVLLIRWLGHSASKQIVKACKTAKVRFIVVQGGKSAAKRETLEAIEILDSDG